MCDIMQYRVAIGIFSSVIRGNIKTFRAEKFFWTFIYLNFVFHLIVVPNRLVSSGDIESNPGPQLLKNITVCHVNARSLIARGAETVFSKLDEIKSFVLLHKFSMFGVSETWLDRSIATDTISIPGYSCVFRRDRNRHGGGICLYIGDHFLAKRIELFEPPNSEIVCVEFKQKGTKHLLFVCYKPPTQDTLDFLSEIEESLDRIHGYSSIMFMGDFNCKHSSFYSGDPNTAEGGMLKSFFESRQFVQLIAEPTRFSGNSQSCLDLVFTNNPILIDESSVHPVINNCDHAPVSVTLSIKQHHVESYKRKVWDFKHADFATLRLRIANHRWESAFVKTNIDDSVCEFMSMLKLIVESCVPHYSAIIRPREKPFMNSELRRLMRKRDRLHKLLKHSTKQQTRAN